MWGHILSTVCDFQYRGGGGGGEDILSTVGCSVLWGYHEYRGELS